MYQVLHYPDDVRDGAEPGSILGHDEVGRPFAVIDAELDVCPCCEPGPFAEEGCPSCDETGLRTTVHLQYATPEQINAQVARYEGQSEDDTERYLKLRAAGLVR